MIVSNAHLATMHLTTAPAGLGEALAR